MRILILILGFEGLKLSVNGALDLFYNPAFVERIYQNSKYHISVYTVSYTHLTLPTKRIV